MGQALDPLQLRQGLLAAFPELSADIAQELAGQSRLIELNPGQTLFKAGEVYQQAVFVIQTGEIELGRQGQAVLTLGPSHTLGLANYFEDSPYISTATARGNAQVLALPDQRLRALATRYPVLADALHRMLSERLRSRTALPVSGIWSLPARAIMQAPLATCSPDTTVGDAFAMMNRRRIGSLGVVDETQSLLGLITFATLAHGVISGQASARDRVLETVCEPARRIGADTPLWQVQGEQARLQGKYLVVEEDAKPVGIISPSDVLSTLVSRQRSTVPLIAEIPDFTALRLFVERVSGIAHDLRENNRSPRLAVRALSEIHLAVQRRCVELVLAELRAEDRGDPPVAYALLVMGSGGRKEMSLRADQDNAIILADDPALQDPATRPWFQLFCERLNQRLDEVGYDWCTGDIMARNPEFHRSLTEWRRYVSRITELPNEKRARWAAVFFDFATLYGDEHLTANLRAHVFAELKQKPGLLKLMAEDDASGRPALGLFNRLVTASDGERKGKIDLKRNGTRILADAARIYALSEGIGATNTADRLNALVRQGRLDSIFVESVLAAYDELLDLTLGHQLRQAQNQQALDKLLDLDELTPVEEESLRMAMRVIKHLQGRLRSEFGAAVL